MNHPMVQFIFRVLAIIKKVVIPGCSLHRHFRQFALRVLERLRVWSPINKKNIIPSEARDVLFLSIQVRGLP